MLRKWMCLLMVALLVVGGAQFGSWSISTARADSSGVGLVNRKDLKIVATGTKLVESSSGDALWLNAIVENNTGYKIDIYVQNAYLDTTEVKGYGMFDIENGEYRDNDFFMFKALDGGSDAPLHNPSKYIFNFEVRNEETREVMDIIPVYLISSELAGASASNETAKPTAKPTATPDSEYMPLQFFKGAYVEWKDLDNDMFKIRVQVRNNSLLKTVKAFELYMYATDIYGDRIYGADQVYYATTKREVAPRGGVVYSDYLTVPKRSEVDKVYFGINRIVYSDGTVVEASKIDYWNWTID